MKYFKPLILFAVLFLLTTLLCLLAQGFMLFGPLFSVVFFLLGVLAIVVMVDAIEFALFS
jgi:hypothetical protein